MKVKLKLNRRHPNRAMFLGRHTILEETAEYDLNETELAELKSEGGKHWFKVDEDEPSLTDELDSAFDNLNDEKPEPAPVKPVVKSKKKSKKKKSKR